MNPPSTENITIDSVKDFIIYENYDQQFPCTHNCRIILKDGRKVDKDLIGYEISLLITAIAKEKISFIRDKDLLTWEPQTIDHFECYKNLNLRQFYLSDKILLPEQILAKAFLA